MTLHHQAILEFFQDYQAYDSLGKALLKQGNWAGAISCWYQSIKLQPNDAWLYYHLGEAFSKQSNFSKAANNFRRAIELEDNVLWFHLQLGKVLSQQQNFEQAIICFQKVIKLQPQYPWVYHSLAEALIEQDKLVGAIKAYKQAIEADGSISLFYERIYFLEQAITKKDLGNNSDSNNFLTSNEASSANSKIQSLQTEATSFLGQHNLTSALKCYQEIIQLDEDYGNIYYQIGQIYNQLDQAELAQDYYQQASLLKDFDHDSNVLQVFFSARHLTSKCRYHFLDLVSNFPGKKLFIRDLQDAWYNKGLPGLTQNVEQTATYLKTIIAEENIDKVVFFGASSGGYAALLYGYLLQIDEIHAFGAQTKIPNNDQEAKLLTGVEPSYFDLSKTFQPQSLTNICHIYFDNQFPTDLNHANRLAHYSQINLHGYDAGVGHKIAMWLKHQKLLRPIILNTLK